MSQSRDVLAAEAAEYAQQLKEAQEASARKDDELVELAANRAVLEAEALDRAQQLEELRGAAMAKDQQLDDLAQARAALEESAKEQATELEVMAEKMKAMQSQLDSNATSHTSGVHRSAAAVERALETNDTETREKMEEMEAELTKMLCHLHMKQAMLGFHE